MNGYKARTAVILAGGAGLRLRPLTNSQPKVMVRVLNKPILQWVIEWLKHCGIRRVILGVAYCKEAVMDYFGDGAELGVEINYSVHSVDGETGEGFNLAINRFVEDDVFVAMNGDEITNLNLKEMVDHHCNHGTLATIAVTCPRSPFGVVTIQEDGLIAAFEEKPLIPSLLVNMGVYVFSQSVKDYLPEKGRIEEITFPSLAKKKLLGSYIVKNTWMTVNTAKDLKLTEDILSKRVREETWLK